MAKTESAAIQPFTMQEIESELQMIDAKLKEYQPLVQRRSDLYNLKLLMMRLRTGSVEGVPQNVPSSNGAGKKGRTSDTAYKVLSQRGELVLDDLIAAMHSEGWKGSGNAAKDKKTVYVSLHRQPDRFERAGKKWRLTKQKELALK